MSKKLGFVVMTALVLSLGGNALAQIGPAGWWAEHIGDGVDGSVSAAGSTYTIIGDGHDIWDNSDGFQYMYKTLTGDGSMTARVVSVGTGSNTWAKGGVMIRQNNTGPSQHAMMVITGSAGQGASFQQRVTNAGGGSNTDAAAQIAAPQWVKIVRTGNAFLGSTSPDGKTWTAYGTPVTVNMTDPVLIGLCVTSHAAGELRTMTFDNVSFTGKITDRPPQLKAWSPDPANGKVGVSLPLFQWKPGETAIFHNVYFGTTPDLTDADLKATRQPFAMYYHVTGLQPGTTYYWRVDEIDAAGTVTKGDVWSFTAVPVKDYQPAPVDGAAGQLPGLILTWVSGKDALSHQVYFGTDAAAVAAGAASVDKGKVTETQFNTGALRASTTYYWRVDAVKLDKSATKGDVWSFSTADAGPANKIKYEYWLNIAGTAVSDLLADARYPSSPDSATYVDLFQSPADWADNYGQRLWGWLKPPQTGDYTFWIAGDDEQQLWLSTDGSPTNVVRIANVAGWTPAMDWDNTGGGAGGPGQKSAVIKLEAGKKYFIMALGKEGGGGDSTDVAWQGPGIAAREVIKGKYVDMFYLAPLQAFGPNPANGAVDVSQAPVLSWMAGDKAQKHDVYFGEDKAAVAAADSKSPLFKGSQAGTTFSPGDLAWGKTYYWRIDETNPAEADSPWKGTVWSFTTANYIPVDDMESYNDTDNLIYDTWLDNFDPKGDKSGSVVGNDPAPFAERTIVHGGKQSMPMGYNNAGPKFLVSETVREFSPLANWTGNGVDTLSVWFRGQAVAFADKGGNAFTVSAGGNDIWNSADAFRFAYKTLNGNGTMTAKVESLVNTDPWAKAGVMIRETLNAGSRNAFMPLSVGNSCSWQWRPVADGVSSNTGWTGTAVTAPYWVRITRTGNAFKGETSPDGKTWTQLGTDTTVTMTASVYIGLAVTAHNAARVTTAEFSNVSAGASVTGAWQVAAIGTDPQPANAPDKLYVIVADSAGKTATATNADPAAVNATVWTQWKIPLSSLTGVNLAKVKTLSVGVGNKTAPAAGGTGRIFIDDIQVTKP